VAAESGHKVLDQDTNAGILTAIEHNITLHSSDSNYLPFFGISRKFEACKYIPAPMVYVFVEKLNWNSIP
jgi:hypothetical protein